MKQLSRKKAVGSQSVPVIASVITPRSARLPQVVQLQSAGLVGFWGRALVAGYHVRVLGLLAPFDPERR
jgi:hypothetical protein